MSDDIEGTHPYQRLCEQDAVYKYEKFLRLQRRNCSGQRFTAICILASTITLIIILLCFFGGNNDIWAGAVANGFSYYDISANTTCGRVEGEAVDDGFLFKGIPYALPPTGKKRFQRSEGLLKHKGCWHGRWEKKTFGNKCVQRNPLTGKIEGDENCLYLNVFTPTLDTESGLPVVVYVHGGDFQWGSGHELGLSPDMSVAHEFNIIVVTFNYRLSVFGFLALDLPSNSSTSELRGNYGLHDQILALKWVRENIKNFGGDPDKITLFGHGSGATSGLAMLASTHAKGLFQRQWLSSPKLTTYTPLQEAKESNENFLQTTNCSTLDCLLKMSPLELFSIFLDTQNNTDFLTLDGDILSQPADTIWKNDVINDVPLLIGSTAQNEEIELPIDSSSWDILQFKEFIQQIPHFIHENNVDLLSHLYYNESNPQISVLSALSDKKSVCPTNYLSNQARVLLSPVFRYIVTGRLSQVVQLPFTHHLGQYSFSSIDLIVFFGLLKHYIKEPSENDYMLKEQIQSMAIDFIRCGSMQMSSWKPYPRKLAEISTQINLVTQYHKEQCQFWRHIAVN